jgi:hypothetical protein
VDVTALASALGTVASTVVAVFAWRAARNSANAAFTLTRIETTRLHAELRPQFEATAHLVNWIDEGVGAAVIILTQVEPKSQHGLDRIELTVRPNYRAQWNVRGPRIPIENEYVFMAPEGDGIVPDELVMEDVILGDPRTAALMMTEYGARDPKRRPNVLLLAVCHLAGYEPWKVPIAIEVREVEVNGRLTKLRPSTSGVQRLAGDSADDPDVPTRLDGV